MREEMNLQKEEKRNEEYQELVERVTPKDVLPLKMLKAFLMGGLICLLGQVILWASLQLFGMDKEAAADLCSMLLILLSVLLTGFNLYPSLANFGGAGALVPITGFANGVAASALEYKAEGQVFGIGCQIFKIAGPVILYGICFSWFLGMLYWFIK